MPQSLKERSPDADERHNPGERHWDDEFNNITAELQNQENSTPDMSEFEREFDDQPANDDTRPGKKDMSQFGDSFNAADAVKNNEEGLAGSWVNNVKSGSKAIGSGKFNWKKKSGVVGIVSAIAIAIASIISFFGGPGLLIVNFAEKMNEKFNYQLASMDFRTQKILNAKIKNSTTGLCSPVTIRCKYATFSDKEIANFKKAGIEIEVDKKLGITGRNKITSMTFENKTVSPSDFLKEMKDNPKFNLAVKRGFNPKFAGFTDSVWAKVARWLKISKLAPFKDLADGTDEARAKLIADETVTGKSATGVDTIPCDTEDCTKQKEDAKSQQSDLDKAASEAADGDQSQTTKALKELDATDLSKGVASATSIIKITGVIDDACTVYGMIKATSMGAKVIRTAQMARYAMIFLKTASMIKAGEATNPDDVSYLGNTLTKTVIDSNGKETKSATDSFGYRYAAFGDKGIANDANAMRYMAGAGLTGKLDGVMEAVLLAVGGVAAADTTCKINNNFFVQGGSFIVGLALWILPGGQAIQAGKLAMQAVLAAATFAAQLILPAMLADIIAGRLVDGDTFGESSGNAIVSGSGHLHSRLAQGGGNAPLRAKQAAEYVASTESVLAEYRELDRLTYSPWDASNPNTFMGSIYTQFAPYLTSGSASLYQLASTPLSIVGSTFSNLTPKASAAESDFQECKDPDYQRIGIATDPFCNPVFGLPLTIAYEDPNVINERLLSKGLIDETSGEPTGAYVDFVKNCIDRQLPIGSTGEDSTAGDGGECFIPEKTSGYTDEEQTKIDMYNHYIDQRVLGTMENGYTSQPTVSGSTSAPTGSDTTGQLAGELAWPMSKSLFDKNKTDWLDKHSANSGTWTSGVRSLAVDISATTGTPVYAMLGGTVTKADLGGHGVLISSSIQGGTLKIAYAHGPRINQNTTYNAGDQIMTSGCLGNCFGPHLHIDMAFNGKGVCPQDVFIAMNNNQMPDFAALAAKASAPCAGRS